MSDPSVLIEWGLKVGPVLAGVLGTWALLKHQVAEAHKKIADLASKADLVAVDRKAQVAHERLDTHEDAQNVAEVLRARELGGIVQRLDGIDKDLGRIEAGSRYAVDTMTTQIGRIEVRLDDYLGRTRSGGR